MKDISSSNYSANSLNTKPLIKNISIDPGYGEKRRIT